MSFTADVLRRQYNTNAVKHESMEIYRSIKSRIRDVGKTKNCIEYDLPVMFHADGFELKDVQLIVYSDIIEELEKEHFAVNIEIGPSYSKLYIRWSAGLDDAERERRKKILQEHMRPSGRSGQPAREEK